MYGAQTRDGVTSGPATKSFIETLNDIAARAQMFTTASGAIVALAGADKDIFTRASAGQLAPGPGTQLRLDASFAGIAVRSAKEIICEDTETDTRADATTYHAIGIRSLAMVPIIENTAVKGVLAVFSDVPNAFSRKDLAVLKTMADVVLSALQGEERSTGVAVDAPHEKSPEPQPTPLPEVAKTMTAVNPSIAPPARSMPTNADLVGAPQPQIRAESEVVPVAESITAPKKVRQPEPAPTRAVKKREEPQSRNNVVPISTATAPAISRQPEPRIESSRQAIAGDLLGILREAAEDRSPSADAGSGRKRVLMIGIGVLGVALIVMLVYFVLRGSKAKAPTAAANTASAPQQTAPTAVYEPPQASNSQPPPQVAQPKKKSSAAKSATETASVEDDSASVRTIVVPPYKPPVVKDDQAAIEPPKIALAGGNMPALGAVPANTPQLAKHIPVVLPPVPIQQPRPMYPELARRMGMAQGSVVMSVHVNRDGTVGDVKVLRGDRVLETAAVMAVKRWRYRPATSDGQPITYNVQVEMKFSSR